MSCICKCFQCRELIKDVVRLAVAKALDADLSQSEDEMYPSEDIEDEKSPQLHDPKSLSSSSLIPIPMDCRLQRDKN